MGATLGVSRLYSPMQPDTKLSMSLGATTKRGGTAASSTGKHVNVRQGAGSATAVPQALGNPLQSRGSAPVAKKNLSLF